MASIRTTYKWVVSLAAVACLVAAGGCRREPPSKAAPPASTRPVPAADSGAAERLSRLEVAARHALEDVRRLSRGLRPPALDELGLVGAIQQAGSEAGIRLDADATDAPDLPAAVEVAAFRIGVEAVINVARHAGVREASLELSVDAGELQLRITDTGTGLRGSTAGVGVLAMHERAEEVGGRVDVLDLRPGVRVEARLPIPVSATEVSAPTGADR